MQTSQETIEFCKIISKCHSYPIHYFFEQILLWERPIPPADLVLKHLDIFLNNTSTLSFFQTPENLIYGIVHSIDRKHMIIIGPVPTTPLTIENIRSILTEYELLPDTRDSLISYLGRTSGHALPHFKNVLSLINFQLNNQSEEFSHSLLQQSSMINHEILNQSLDLNIRTFSSSDYLAAYAYECETLTHVKSGNVTGILNRSSTSRNMHVGVLSGSSLRQHKNLFICTTTLVTRSAIEGGLDHKSAYQLSDLYLQKAESVTTTVGMNELFDAMFLDFTERTHKIKQDRDMPFDIFECLQYIRQNTHTPLRIEVLATHMHLSKSQLNRRFKKALDFSPSEFILRCKLEEAKELLKNTNCPIGEISQLLCFSSQSHFCNTFRKKYNISPREYREQSKKVPREA